MGAVSDGSSRGHDEEHTFINLEVNTQGCPAVKGKKKGMYNNFLGFGQMPANRIY